MAEPEMGKARLHLLPEPTQLLYEYQRPSLFISGLRAFWVWNGLGGAWAGSDRYVRMITNRYTDRSGQKAGGGARRHRDRDSNMGA